MLEAAAKDKQKKTEKLLKEQAAEQKKAKEQQPDVSQTHAADIGAVAKLDQPQRGEDHAFRFGSHHEVQNHRHRCQSQSE